MMKQMILFFVLTVSVMTAAPAITQEVVEYLTPKLNSDRILYFFGSYGVEPMNVISSPFGASRIANLYSIEGQDRVMRTLAVVNFTQPVDAPLQAVHAKIIEGQSVGLALRQDGWVIDKDPLYFGTIALPLQLQAKMQVPSNSSAAVHMYKLYVSKASLPHRLHYCTMIEVHSPHYLSEEWLKALHVDQYDSCRCPSDEAKSLINSLHQLIID